MKESRALNYKSYRRYRRIEIARTFGGNPHVNSQRYGKRCDSHKGGDRGRSDLRNACRRMNHVEYSHAKDVGESTGRSVLLVHPERGTVQYRSAHSVAAPTTRFVEGPEHASEFSHPSKITCFRSFARNCRFITPLPCSTTVIVGNRPRTSTCILWGDYRVTVICQSSAKSFQRKIVKFQTSRVINQNVLAIMTTFRCLAMFNQLSYRMFEFIGRGERFIESDCNRQVVDRGSEPRCAVS